MKEVEEARKTLQAETQAFHAQRQAWQAFMRSCQQQQGNPSRTGLQPDYSVVPIRGLDTYQVRLSFESGHKLLVGSGHLLTCSGCAAVKAC